MTQRSGRCLCGAIKFTARLKTEKDGIHIDACHCGMCRRQIGGPLLGVNLEEPPQIEDDTQLAVYESSEWAERMFCKKCGSNLFYRMKDGSLYTVHAGAIDDLSDAKFTVEIFIDDKPDYYAFAGERKRMTGAEVMAAFAAGELS